ncbi:YqjF family protein [Arthrobacter sp. YAF17]|uniref:YqjF family protein n=1 Tax=Arthrobacter sp. YAF17 TaxID=3233077 RepID=UPI003F936940
MDPDPWPRAPQLPAPIIMDQRWTDAVFLHWRIPESVAGSFMPPGVVPDNFDGSAWVGLIGFRMQGAGLGRGPGIPYFGSFTEINVRLYSREPDGTRGVVFLSLDASRLAVVLAARAAGIPYVWSRAGFRGAGVLDPVAAVDGGGPAAGPQAGYRVRRLRGGAQSNFAVAPEFDVGATDPLSLHLTARFGLHTRFRGRTLYVPNTHTAWPLYRAHLISCEDQLVAASGIDVEGPPESVLFSPGVRTQFGRPRVLSGRAGPRLAAPSGRPDPG